MQTTSKKPEHQRPPTSVPEYRRWLKAAVDQLLAMEAKHIPPQLKVLDVRDFSANELLKQTRKHAIRLHQEQIAARCNGQRLPLERVSETLSGCLSLLDESVSSTQKTLLTVAEAAKQFNLSRRTIYRLIKDGLPHVKARGAIRIKASALESYLEQQGQSEQQWESAFD